MSKKAIYISLGVLLLLVVGLIALGSGNSPTPSPTPTQTPTETPQTSPQVEEVTPTPVVEGTTTSAPTTDGILVTKVIDGDTIQLESGETVRYIGIDTPESVHPSKPVQCFSTEASAKNKELVEGKRVRLEKDVSETDKYNRLLRYVYVGDTFVNDYLVRQGYANANSYPPDVKYQDQFRQAEQEARTSKRGLWGSCPTTTQSTTSTGTTTPKPQPTQTATTPKPASGSSPSGSASTGGDKDCPDFKTQAEAQAFFISQGGPSRDPHKLDQDKDGVACESLK